MSDGRKYYCFCSSNCKYETMTKEQIMTAIAQAVSTGRVGDIDTGFVTKVKDQNGGNYVTFWVGTQVQYNALAEKAENCMYIITDDTSAADLLKAASEAATTADNARAEAVQAAERAANILSDTSLEAEDAANSAAAAAQSAQDAANSAAAAAQSAQDAANAAANAGAFVDISSIASVSLNRDYTSASVTDVLTRNGNYIFVPQMNIVFFAFNITAYGTMAAGDKIVLNHSGGYAPRYDAAVCCSNEKFGGIYKAAQQIEIVATTATTQGNNIRCCGWYFCNGA